MLNKRTPNSCLFKGRFFSLQMADLGCSECILLMKLKFHHDIELLVGVDIDDAKMKKKMYVGFLHGSQLQTNRYNIQIAHCSY